MTQGFSRQDLSRQGFSRQGFSRQDLVAQVWAAQDWAAQGWAARFAVLLGVLSCACAPSNPTQLVVVVDSDVAPLDEVEVVVSGLAGGEQAAFARLSDGALPRWVVLERRGGALGPIEVTAHARVGGARTGVSSAARTSFVRGQTRRLDLFLAAACEATRCGNDETCGRVGCQPLEVAPETLPPWEPPDAGLDDGGVDDGGVDGGDDGGDGGNACACPDGPLTNVVGTRCEGLRCVLICADATGDCDGRADNGCEQRLDTRDDCGACDALCPLPTDTEVRSECTGGSCVVECAADRGNCNGEASDGCEVDLLRTKEHCGECGNACANRCNNGSCVGGA